MSTLRPSLICILVISNGHPVGICASTRLPKRSGSKSSGFCQCRRSRQAEACAVRTYPSDPVTGDLRNIGDAEKLPGFGAIKRKSSVTKGPSQFSSSRLASGQNPTDGTVALKGLCGFLPCPEGTKC